MSREHYESRGDGVFLCEYDTASYAYDFYIIETDAGYTASYRLQTVDRTAYYDNGRGTVIAEELAEFELADEMIDNFIEMLEEERREKRETIALYQRALEEGGNMLFYYLIATDPNFMRFLEMG